MRHILLLLFFGLTVSAKATIRTVSNNPTDLAQFNTIQEAIDAAISGDTILVHGSPNSYAGFTLSGKKLAIMGPGWNPNKIPSHIAYINGNVILSGAGATGSEFHGLSFFSNINVNSLGINDIRFIRNRLHRSFFNLTPSVGGVISGYVFEGNWFEDAGVGSNNNYTLQNMLFQNNIFFNSGALVSYNIGGFSNSVNVLFDHNLFYGGSSGSRTVFGNVSRFVTLSNNIFVRNNAASGLTGANFYNNITYLTSNDAPWTVNGNVDGGGNIAGTDPEMVAQADVNSGVNNPLLDFSIAGGPANNSGSDNKDRGLLFETVGSLNWVNSRTSRLPYIYSMQTTTPTVAPGGSVSVTVEARTSN